MAKSPRKRSPHVLRTLTAALAATLASGTCTAELALEGFTEPYRTVEVAAPEPGVVAVIDVREGAVVQAGASLARLDTRLLAAARDTSRTVANATARRRAAEAQLRLGTMRLAKLEALARQGSARSDEVAVARGEVEKASAEMAATDEMRAFERLKLAEIEAQIETRHIRSPLNGVVVKLHREVGEFVGPNAMQLATVVQLDPLRLNVFLPTSLLEAFTVGKPVALTCNGEAIAAAEVEFISPVTDAESGTARCKIVIPNPAGKLRSGLHCALQAAGQGATTTTGTGHEQTH